MDFPGGSNGKASAYNMGDWGSIPGSGRSPRQPTPVLSPGKFHGQRSLVGYSPWGRQESDTTERLYFHFSSHRMAVNIILKRLTPIPGFQQCIYLVETIKKNKYVPNTEWVILLQKKEITI